MNKDQPPSVIETRIATIMNSIPAGIALLSETCEIEAVSPFMERLTGLKSKDLVGQQLGSLLSKSHDEDLKRLLTEVGKGNAVLRRELAHSNGDSVSVLIASNVVESGTETKFVICIVDISIEK